MSVYDSRLSFKQMNNNATGGDQEIDKAIKHMRAMHAKYLNKADAATANQKLEEAIEQLHAARGAAADVRKADFMQEVNKIISKSNIGESVKKLSDAVEKNRAAQKKIARLRMFAVALTVVGVVATIAAGVASK